MQFIRQSVQFFNQSKFVFIAAVLSLIKITIIHSLMGITSIGLTSYFTNFLVLLSIYLVVCGIMPQKNASYGLFGGYLLIAVLAYADLVHYRYFQGPISIYSIFSANEAAAVGSSIKALLRPFDGFLFMDVVLLFLWMIYNRNTLGRSSKRAIYLIPGLMLLLVLAAANLLYAEPQAHTVERVGIIGYHFYDVVQLGRGKGDLKEDNLIEELKTRQKLFADKSRKHFGQAKGRNVFVIQVESLNNFVIGREVEGQTITPVINDLIKQDSIYFNHYFQQLGRGNTSDAEFVSHNSIYPSMGVYTYKQYEGNDFYTLPMALKENGYSTIAFHGNDPDFWNRRIVYNRQGIDQYISQNEMDSDEILGMGISDSSVFRQSISHILNMPQPFYGFYITLTSHKPFLMPKSHQKLTINGKLKGTFLDNYFQSIHYLDHALGEFIESLKEKGLYENSMIVLYGDHHAIDVLNTEIRDLTSDFIGKPFDYDEFLKTGLIIHMPGSGIVKNPQIAGGQIDFFPTMMNLLGVVPTKGYIMGQDLLNAKQGFVASQTYLIKGSFIDNDVLFEMARDGVFEHSRAWNIHTGAPVDLAKCKAGYEKAIREINLSNYLLHNNLTASQYDDIKNSGSFAFSDIEGHWAEEMIIELYKRGVIAPTMEGRFNPDSSLSRADWLIMLGRANKWVVEKNSTYADLGKDYAQPYIQAAVKKGIIDSGQLVESNYFSKEITYGELVNWLEKVKKQKKDLEQLRSETEFVTRAEAVKLLYHNKL